MGLTSCQALPSGPLSADVTIVQRRLMLSGDERRLRSFLVNQGPTSEYYTRLSPRSRYYRLIAREKRWAPFRPIYRNAAWPGDLRWLECANVPTFRSGLLFLILRTKCALVSNITHDNNGCVDSVKDVSFATPNRGFVVYNVASFVWGEVWFASNFRHG